MGREVKGGNGREVWSLVKHVPPRPSATANSNSQSKLQTPRAYAVMPETVVGIGGASPGAGSCSHGQQARHNAAGHENPRHTLGMALHGDR